MASRNIERRYRGPPSSRPTTKQVAQKQDKLVDLDRTKTCPFLLRVFWKLGGHHPLDLFDKVSTIPQDDQVQIYTWKDATLRELTELIQQVVPEACEGDHTILEFNAIYVSFKMGKANTRTLGKVLNKKKTEDDNKTLQDLHFETGDLIDVAIIKG
jgi:histone deacetylase complex subunit SAP18